MNQNNENIQQPAVFDKTVYFEKIEKIIQEIITKEDTVELSYDILDTENTLKYKTIALKERQRQMKVGEIWQEILGNYAGFINLKNGHSSGLDILSHSKKIAIELKNRVNTDNNSSRKSNLDKLSKFKKKNPEYRCIYATINHKTKRQTLKGNITIIQHNNVEIEHHIGYTFLAFILQEHTDEIIEFIKKTINHYTDKTTTSTTLTT